MNPINPAEELTMLPLSWKLLPALAAGLVLVASGCLKSTGSAPAPTASNDPSADQAKGGGPGIRQIMFKIGRGPQGLDKALTTALQSESPTWDTVQTQTAEYVQLTTDLTKLDPPRGDKESWQKHTQAFGDAAKALDRAAQAKDQAAAKSAQDLLSGSCMQCHQEHKRMGRGG
jgi:hypothetical protein